MDSSRTSAAILRRFRGLALPHQLRAAGIGADFIEAQLRELRWRRIGPAIVLHYRALTPDQQRRAAQFGHGPAAVLASFTALASYGLDGWQRDGELHIAAPAGTPAFQHPELPLIVLHEGRAGFSGAAAEPVVMAAVRAARSQPDPRIGCGLLAAVVGQGVVHPEPLRSALLGDPDVPEVLVRAGIDMGQGEDALLDLDLTALCRTAQVAGPVLQQRRREPSGQRRYLEAVWDAGDGSRFVIEVDGALHYAARRWWDAQLRPSDLTTSSSGVLRVPSAVLRCEPGLVLGVVRRALLRHRAAG